MLEIPVTVGAFGIQYPSTPLPAHALAVSCDGTVYRVAQTPEEAALITPVPPVSEGTLE